MSKRGYNLRDQPRKHTSLYPKCQETVRLFVFLFFFPLFFLSSAAQRKACRALNKNNILPYDLTIWPTVKNMLFELPLTLMLLMTLGISVKASLHCRKLLFQRGRSKNWECSCLTWWSKECGKLGKAGKANSQRPGLKVAVSRNAFWAMFKTALLQEQRAPEAKYLKTDYMYHVQLRPRWSREQISPCFSQTELYGTAAGLGLCSELAAAEPQPCTAVPAQLRRQQQSALGISVSDAGLQTQEGQSHAGSDADAYLQYPLRDIEMANTAQHMSQRN